MQHGNSVIDVVLLELMLKLVTLLQLLLLAQQLQLETVEWVRLGHLVSHGRLVLERRAYEIHLNLKIFKRNLIINSTIENNLSKNKLKFN